MDAQSVLVAFVQRCVAPLCPLRQPRSHHLVVVCLPRPAILPLHCRESILSPILPLPRLQLSWYVLCVACCARRCRVCCGWSRSCVQNVYAPLTQWSVVGCAHRTSNRCNSSNNNNGHANLRPRSNRSSGINRCPRLNLGQATRRRGKAQQGSRATPLPMPSMQARMRCKPSHREQQRRCLPPSCRRR